MCWPRHRRLLRSLEGAGCRVGERSWKRSPEPPAACRAPRPSPAFRAPSATWCGRPRRGAWWRRSTRRWCSWCARARRCRRSCARTRSCGDGGDGAADGALTPSARAPQAVRDAAIRRPWRAAREFSVGAACPCVTRTSIGLPLPCRCGRKLPAARHQEHARGIKNTRAPLHACWPRSAVPHGTGGWVEAAGGERHYKGRARRHIMRNRCRVARALRNGGARVAARPRRLRGAGPAPWAAAGRAVACGQMRWWRAGPSQ